MEVPTEVPTEVPDNSTVARMETTGTTMAPTEATTTGRFAWVQRAAADAATKAAQAAQAAVAAAAQAAGDVVAGAGTAAAKARDAAQAGAQATCDVVAGAGATAAAAAAAAAAAVAIYVAVAVAANRRVVPLQPHASLAEQPAANPREVQRQLAVEAASVVERASATAGGGAGN